MYKVLRVHEPFFLLILQHHSRTHAHKLARTHIQLSMLSLILNFHLLCIYVRLVILFIRTIGLVFLWTCGVSPPWKLKIPVATDICDTESS